MAEAQTPIETGAKVRPETPKGSDRPKIEVSPAAKKMGEELARDLGEGRNPDEIAQSLAEGDRSPLRGTMVGAIMRPDGTLDTSRAMVHFDTKTLAESSDREERIAADNDHIRSRRYKEQSSVVPGTVDAVARSLQQTIDVNLKIVEDPETLPKVRESTQKNLDALRAQRAVLDEIIDDEAARIIQKMGIKEGLIDKNSPRYNQSDEIIYRQAEGLSASEASDRAYAVIDKLNERFPKDPVMAVEQKFKINQAENLALKLSDEQQHAVTQSVKPKESKAAEQQKETPKTASEDNNILDITYAEDGVSDVREVMGHAQLIEEYGPEKMQEIDEKIANGTATEEEKNNFNYIYNIDRKASGETYGEFYDRLKEELAAASKNEFNGAAEQPTQAAAESNVQPKPAVTRIETAPPPATPRPVETAAPKESLEKIAEELARQTRERGFGVLHGFTAPVDHIPVGYYEGRGFAMGQQIKPDLGSGNDYLSTFLNSRTNKVDFDTLNPYATNGRQVWTSSSFEPMKHWTTEAVVKKGLFKKEVVKTQHEEYTAFTSPNGQKMHGEKDWVSYSYHMPVISAVDKRAGAYTQFNFIVPPDIASKIDTAITKDPAFADMFYQATFPGITGPDERNYIRRARATELAIVNRRDMYHPTTEIRPYSKPIEY